MKTLRVLLGGEPSKSGRTDEPQTEQGKEQDTVDDRQNSSDGDNALNVSKDPVPDLQPVQMQGSLLKIVDKAEEETLILVTENDLVHCCQLSIRTLLKNALLSLQRIIKFKDEQLLEMTKMQFEYSYDGTNFVYKKSDDERTKRMENLLNEARVVVELLLELIQEAAGDVYKEWNHSLRICDFMGW